MRTLVVLLGALLLVPTAMAEQESPQETPVRVATEVTQNATAATSPCLEAAQGLRETPTEPVVATEACRALLPDCRPVYVTIHDHPFGLEPDVQEDCPNEWVSFAWEFVWSLL